jgi:L-asparaginase II
LPPSAAESGLVRLAAVLRGEIVEAIHCGAAAVVAPGGEPIAAAGDPAFPTVARSAVKPIQALPLVMAGGVERYALDDADLALVCSSHGGTPAHVARAAALLARGGFGVADLACGAHPPSNDEAARALAAAGEEPTPLHNNCSGKHAGMLLACRLLDLDPDGYLDFSHPLQRRLREEVARVAGADPGLRRAIDGCSAPTYELTVAELARAFAALAAPAAAPLDDARRAALGRIGAAMAAAPGMVAGPGRFTTALIAATGGRLLGKEGAEGVYGVAVRGPRAMGLAVKIADGAKRARDTVVLELLVQLGALSGEEQRALAPFARPRLVNHRGLEVGAIVAEVELVERGD